MKVVRATRGGVWSIWRRARYSSAISDNNDDLGLKLSIIPAISTGCNLEGLLQAPPNTLPRRFAYAAASDASLERANLIKEP